MAINERATVEVQVNGQQAKQELRDLESYANSLKGRLAEAHKAGDTKQIKKLEAELRKTNAEMKVMRTNAKNIDVAMNNIGLATPKELKQLLKDINAKLNSGHIKRGSEEWRRYQAQLKQVNAELKKVNDETKETESWLTRFNNKFSKWGALAASAIAAITGVSLALSKMRSDRNAKESSAANLKALTGLDDTSIQWLTRQAEILSTAMDKTGLRVTQSSKDILEAYMLVGSAKPDLLEDKEALNAVTVEAMRLSVAAKMDLKEAVDAVTLSMNQYGAASDEAAKYTNVMAAGSKFGSASVQSITAAVTKAGVSASGANVSIEELVASIEALGEKGIKDEVAGTGLKMFFLRLQTGADETNPRVVGLQKALQNLQKLSVDEVVKRFGAETFTVAKTLIDGAEKVDYYTKAVTGTNVAMEQAAINSDTAEAKMAQLKNEIKEAGITLMEKLNPSLSILMGWSTKLIKAVPALIDFTKEYGATILWCAAVLLAYTARQKMLVATQIAINALTRTSTILAGAYKLAAISLNDALAGDCKVLGRLATQMASSNIVTKIIAASTMLYRAAIELLTLRLKGAAIAMKGFWAVLGLSPVGLLFAALTAAVAISYKWNKAIRERYDLQTTLNKIEEKTTEIYEKEKTKIKELWDAIHDNNKSLDERKKAILKLQEIMPEYKAQISEEGKVINESTQNLDKLNESLLLNIKLETLRKELFDRYKTIEELEKSPALKDNSLMGAMAREDVRTKLAEERVVLEGLKNEYKDLYTQKLLIPNVVKKKIGGDDNKKCPKCGNYPCTCQKELSDKKKQEKLKEDLKKAESDAAKAEADIKARYAKGESAYRAYCQEINNNDIKELDAKMLLYNKESNEFNQLLSKKQDLLKKGLEQETKFTIDEIEACAKAEEISLLDSYYNQKINKYALNEALFMLDIASLSDKQALYKKDSKEWHEYEEQITDLENNNKLQKQKEFQDMLSELREQYNKKDLSKLMQEEIESLNLIYEKKLIKEEEFQQLLNDIKSRYAVLQVEDSRDNSDKRLEEARGKGEYDSQKEGTGDSFWGSLFGQESDIHGKTLDNLKNMYNAGKLTHKEYLDAMAEENNNYFGQLAEKVQEYYSHINAVVSSYADFTQASSDLEIAKIEKKYEAEIEAAGNNKTKVAKLEKEKDKAIATEKTKANKRSTGIQISQALAETAMSAISAYAAGWEAGFPAGPILAPLFAGMALAAGMLQVATIKKQAQAQEIGFYSGGFTSKGDYRKEAGVVHQGEFVANHQTVNNPNVMPVLRLIDNAQRNNTVGSLTARDITNSLRGYNNGGFVSTGSKDHAAGGADNESLLNMIGYTSSVIEKLEKRLNEPFLTVNTVDGEHGIKQAMDKYEQTIKIKSR